MLTFQPAGKEAKSSYEDTLAFLKMENIRGGYTDYWISYVITLMSRGEITFTSYQSPERFPPFARYVRQLKRVAYVFRSQSSQESAFASLIKQQGLPFRKKSFGILTTYLVPPK